MIERLLIGAKKSSIIVIAAVALSLITVVCASSEIVQFSDENLRQRYQVLIEELRCPKCQNQNLADSNSPISQDLRAQIQTLLEQQMSDQQIKDYLVSRYSDFILYRPPVSRNTWFLWLAPIFFILIGAAIFLFYHKKRPATGRTEPCVEQQRRLAQLLGDKDQL